MTSLSKRSRVIIVCSNCKKRKKKCDRNQPCSNCTSSNLNCDYTYSSHKPYTQSASIPADLGQKWKKSEKNDSRATSFSRYEPLLGINPYADHSIINFSSKLNSPLSWEALIGRDKFVTSLWSSLFTADVEPIQIEEQKQSRDPSSFHLKLTNIIPDSSTTSQLIDRFFSWVYPFMPFMDEATFRIRTSLILGQQLPADFAWIGILLIILRFASLSHGTNYPHLVKTDAVDLACECLVRTQDSDDNFSVFVLSFFLKLYHKFSPEISGIHEGESTQRANRLLIVRAKLLGLESGNFQDFGHGTKLMQQRIWQFLIMADMYQGYTYGYQLSIANGVNKIKFDDQETLLDQKFDHFVSDMFFLSLKFNDKLINLLNLILNTEGSSTSAVCQSLSNFEIAILKEAGRFGDCLQDKESSRSSIIKKQFSIKNYLVFATFLVSVFWHLFLHFEDQNVNISYYYLVKSMTLVNEILLNLPTALSCDECVFVICPSIEKFINRADQILLGLALRFSQYRQNSAGSDAYIALVASIERNLIKCIQHSFTILDQLPSYYVNGKRIKSVHSILLSKLDSFDFASTLSGKTSCPFDVVQLDDILMRSQIPNFAGSDLHTLEFSDEVMMLDFDVKDRILDFDNYFHT